MIERDQLLLQITNVIPFFVLMTLFIGLGYILSRTVPPYKELVPRLLTKKGYFAELESLRGLLALVVVVHHSVAWYFLLHYQRWEISGPHSAFYSQLGIAPVTLFFFLTGFLFWSKLMRDPDVPFGPFMYARLRRLGPAYWGGAALMFFLVALFTGFRLHGNAGTLAFGMAEWTAFTVGGRRSSTDSIKRPGCGPLRGPSGLSSSFIS